MFVTCLPDQLYVTTVLAAAAAVFSHASTAHPGPSGQDSVRQNTLQHGMAHTFIPTAVIFCKKIIFAHMKYRCDIWIYLCVLCVRIVCRVESCTTEVAAHKSS